MIPSRLKGIRYLSGLIIFFIALILSLSDAQAQTANPQDILKQYIADLKKNPDNYAIRERIIKHARTMKPAPAIPADAEYYVKRAESAFNNAKSEADFAQVAKEYEKALLVAPWVPDYYYNCAITYEKAAKPEEAMRNYDLYLVAVPNAVDAGAIRKHISDLENQVSRIKKYEKGYDYKEKKKDDLLLLNAQKSVGGAWAMSFFIGAFTPFLGSGQYYAESYGTAVCSTLIGLVSYGIFLGGVVPEKNASEKRVQEKRKLIITGGVIFTAVWLIDWIYAPIATMKYNEKLKEKFSLSTGSIVPLFSYTPQFFYTSSDIDHVVKLGMSMSF